MKTKNACILLLAALTMTACEYDDSALWEQVNQNTERIAALEAWQAETNTNIQSLQTLLNTTDYITDVTPVMENGVDVGYTISFLNSDPITIYHGKKGDKGDKGDTGATPQIGVTQGEDGNWYWTLNGELLTDTEGNPIRANGDKGDSAPVPQLSTGSSLTTQGVTHDAEGTDIVADAIYLSVDGGNTWYRVGGEDGDSFFSDVKVTDEAVIFTLADDTTFSVPRYTGIKVDFGDTSSLLMELSETQTVNFTAEGSKSFTTDNLFTVAPYGWKAEVTLPTRAATEFILTVTAPADATSGAAEGEILVMLDNGQGSTTIGRLTVDVKYIIIDGTTLTARNQEAGKLATAIGNRTDLTSITVTSATLNETDWAAVRNNNAALLYLDLAEATYEGTDKDNLIYYTTGTGATPPIISIKLPQGVTGLGEYAFNNCLALTSIDLPDKVTSIRNRAFNSCISLTSITLPEEVKTIGSYTFAGCPVLKSIDLPDGLESIGNNAFAGCSDLESIGLPAGVTSIGDRAFLNCTSLKSITLPEGLTSIGEFTFYTCSALESITLPEGVTSIGNNAFAGCTSLTSITLPEGVTTILGYTFTSCTKLTSITLPDKVTSIGEYAFSNCPSLTSIDLPEGVTDIGKYAFQNCLALTSIDLPDKVTSIGNSTFSSCKGLTSIDLPEGLTDIGNYAFSGCSALKSIDLPEGVTTIGGSAFRYCDALTTVTCQATVVPGLGDYAFSDSNKLANIYVPAGSVDDYKAATGWSAYENIIQAIQ